MQSQLSALLGILCTKITPLDSKCYYLLNLLNLELEEPKLSSYLAEKS